MEACLLERDFECRSANWFKTIKECTLSDQDRHSVSQSEADDQHINRLSLSTLYGPSNQTSPLNKLAVTPKPALAMSTTNLYQNYYLNLDSLLQQTPNNSKQINKRSSGDGTNKYRTIRQLFDNIHKIQKQKLSMRKQPFGSRDEDEFLPNANDWPIQYYSTNQQQASADMPANALVDYLENNCIYEPNKLCEFRKIQNRVLKTVDSIYQDINSLEECKSKCLNAPYRCYSFDYNDTSERVCRTSHLDQASLLSVKDPYLDVVGAITYELASCFNVSIQCRAKEMVTYVSSSKMFKGKIYVKSRPFSCMNDVKESLSFELVMKYHDDNCNVQASSDQQQGVFSNDIIIQNHDRIVTTQDVGISVYCQYDLRNKSITNNVDLAIEKLEAPPPTSEVESKTKNPSNFSGNSSSLFGQPPAGGHHEPGSFNSPLTITSLATTVVKSPNVTMRITNMNGQPVSSAIVGDRLALLFEIKEKTSK